MQETIKKIANKISFFTTHPDVDWRRMFTTLMVLTVFSVTWNIYFYFTIQDKIRESEITQKTRTGAVGAREDDVQDVINTYEKKKSIQSSLITDKVFRLEDPSVL